MELTQKKEELIIVPADYPYLYSKGEDTEIYLGEKYHWRLVSESLVTFMTSKNIVNENYANLEKMGIQWIDPWEKPLHEIYKKNPCYRVYHLYFKNFNVKIFLIYFPYQ